MDCFAFLPFYFESDVYKFLCESWKSETLVLLCLECIGQREEKMLFSSVVCKRRRSPEGGFRALRDIQGGCWPRKSEQLSRLQLSGLKGTLEPRMAPRKLCSSKLYFISTISTWLFFHSPALRFIKGHHIKLWITGDEIFYFQFRRWALLLQHQRGRGAKDMWAAD